MSNKKTKLEVKPIVLTFCIQVSLMMLIAILFVLGRTVESINIGAFFFSIIIGSIGASISIMKRIKSDDPEFYKEYEDLKSWAILMPILYGTLLSGVCYLLFMSGILSGDGGNGLLTTNLFPNFSNTNSYNDNLLDQFVVIKPSSMQDTGKLLVWCFLSGYSEQFVIKILNELENKN